MQRVKLPVAAAPVSDELLALAATARSANMPEMADDIMRSADTVNVDFPKRSGLGQHISRIPVPMVRGQAVSPELIGEIHSRGREKLPVHGWTHDQQTLVESGTVQKIVGDIRLFVDMPPCVHRASCIFLTRSQWPGLGLLRLPEDRPRRPLCQYMTPAEWASMFRTGRCSARPQPCLLCLRYNTDVAEALLNRVAGDYRGVLLQSFETPVTGDDAYDQSAVIQPDNGSYRGFTATRAKFDMSMLCVERHKEFQDTLYVSQLLMRAVPESVTPAEQATLLRMAETVRHHMNKTANFRERSSTKNPASAAAYTTQFMTPAREEFLLACTDPLRVLFRETGEIPIAGQERPWLRRILSEYPELEFYVACAWSLHVSRRRATCYCLGRCPDVQHPTWYRNRFDQQRPGSQGVRTITDLFAKCEPVPSATRNFTKMLASATAASAELRDYFADLLMCAVDGLYPDDDLRTGTVFPPGRVASVPVGDIMAIKGGEEAMLLSMRLYLVWRARCTGSVPNKAFEDTVIKTTNSFRAGLPKNRAVTAAEVAKAAADAWKRHQDEFRAAYLRDERPLTTHLAALGATASAGPGLSKLAKWASDHPEIDPVSVMKQRMTRYGAKALKESAQVFDPTQRSGGISSNLAAVARFQRTNEEATADIARIAWAFSNARHCVEIPLESPPPKTDPGAAPIVPFCWCSVCGRVQSPTAGPSLFPRTALAVTPRDALRDTRGIITDGLSSSILWPDGRLTCGYGSTGPDGRTCRETTLREVDALGKILVVGGLLRAVCEQCGRVHDVPARTHRIGLCAKCLYIASFDAIVNENRMITRLVDRDCRRTCDICDREITGMSADDVASLLLRAEKVLCDRAASVKLVIVPPGILMCDRCNTRCAGVRPEERIGRVAAKCAGLCIVVYRNFIQRLKATKELQRNKFRPGARGWHR